MSRSQSVVTVRCSKSDADLFDRAAVASGFTRPDPDQPNRSSWILAVLRREALKVLEVTLSEWKEFHASETTKKAARKSGPVR